MLRPRRRIPTLVKIRREKRSRKKPLHFGCCGRDEEKKCPFFLFFLGGQGESKTLVDDGLDVHSGLNKFSEKKMFLVVDKK